MKKLLLATTLTFAAIPAQATDFHYCMLIQQTARSAMSAYQAGVSKAELLETADLPITYRMVYDATSRMRFNSEFSRQESANDFSMEYYAMCIDGDI